jgi:chromosome segregation ATPase
MARSIAEATELNERSLSESLIAPERAAEEQAARIRDLEAAASRAAERVAALEAQLARVAAERDDLHRRLEPVGEIEALFSQVLQEKLVLAETAGALRKENAALQASLEEKTAAWERRMARVLEAESARADSEVTQLRERVQELEGLLTGNSSAAPQRAREAETGIVAILRFEKQFLSRLANLQFGADDGFEFRPLIASVMFVLRIQRMAAGLNR